MPRNVVKNKSTLSGKQSERVITLVMLVGEGNKMASQFNRELLGKRQPRRALLSARSSFTVRKAVCVYKAVLLKGHRRESLKTSVWLNVGQTLKF